MRRPQWRRVVPSLTRCPVSQLAALLCVVGCGDDDDNPPKPTTVLEEIEVGTVAASSVEGKTLDLELPADAISASLILESAGAGVLTTGVRDPMDNEIIDGEAPHVSPNPMLPQDVVASVLIPITPRITMQGGTYQLTPRSFGEDGDVRVRALVKRPDPMVEPPPTLETQVYNVNVFLAAIDLDEDDANLEYALDRTRQVLEQVGLSFGERTTTTLDVPEDEQFLEVDGVTGESPAFLSLLARSSGAKEDALNLFIVEEFDIAFQGLTLVGLAGGIPVPPVRGTARSGVVVSAYWLRQNPGLTGLIMAHEVAHAFGLFHTTEVDFSATDPLDDTAECTIDQDSDGDGLLSSSECRTLDGTNLMFPIADPDRPPELTADQGWVLRRSALAR